MPNTEQTDNNQDDTNNAPSNTASKSFADNQAKRSDSDTNSEYQSRPKWSSESIVHAGINFLIAIAAICGVSNYWDTTGTQISIQRPFVVASNIQHLGTFKSGTHYIEQWWTNSGETPAKNVVIQWSWGFDMPFIFPQNGWKEEFGVQTLVPHTGSIASVLPLSEEDRRHANAVHHIYTWGRLTWKDYFPNHQDITHVSHYCSDLSEMNGEVDTFSWNLVTSCKKYTCVDEECKEDYAKLNPRR